MNLRKLRVVPIALLVGTLGLSACTQQEAASPAASPADTATSATGQTGDAGGGADTQAQDAVSQAQEAVDQAREAVDQAQQAVDQARDAAGDAGAAAGDAATRATDAARSAAAQAGLQVDLNTASRAEIEAALRDHGVTDPARWAAELEKLRPVESDQVAETLREELAKRNVDQQTLRSILDSVRL